MVQNDAMLTQYDVIPSFQICNPVQRECFVGLWVAFGAFWENTVIKYWIYNISPYEPFGEKTAFQHLRPIKALVTGFQKENWMTPIVKNRRISIIIFPTDITWNTGFHTTNITLSFDGSILRSLIFLFYFVFITFFIFEVFCKEYCAWCFSLIIQDLND